MEYAPEPTIAISPAGLECVAFAVCSIQAAITDPPRDATTGIGVIVDVVHTNSVTSQINAISAEVNFFMHIIVLSDDKILGFEKFHFA